MRTAAPRHSWRVRALAPWLAVAACFNPADETSATTDEPVTTTTTAAATTTFASTISETTSISPTTAVDDTTTTDTTTGADPSAATTSDESSTGADACGDGDPDEGEECDDGNEVDGDGCDRDCQYSLRIVFATKGQVSALMAHPVTADALCDAEGKSVYPGHRFVAWTSAATMPVVARLGPGTKPYYLPGGDDLVAADLAELLSGALQRPISRDVHGNSLGPAPAFECTILTNEVWTGTLIDGTTAINTCADWTTTDMDGFAEIGDLGLKGNKWTEACQRRCDNLFRLYCIEVPVY